MGEIDNRIGEILHDPNLYPYEIKFIESLTQNNINNIIEEDNPAIKLPNGKRTKSKLRYFPTRKIGDTYNIPPKI